jgi:hypothetical protein
MAEVEGVPNIRKELTMRLADLSMFAELPV